jgi:hypothetical protein
VKEIEILKREVKKHGVAYVSALIGFRDTGRVKNWIIRKKVPKEFSETVLGLEAKSQKGKK